MKLRKVILCVLCICIMSNAVVCSAEEDTMGLSCPSAILMEQSTGKILYQKDANSRKPMASVTKIMTMLLAMEAIDEGKMTYDDMITGSAYAKSMGGSTIFLDEGEQLSVRDMLKGIAVSSGNDAAVAMGEHIAGSADNFVAMMNKRAAELGMKDSNFVNCNGLDADGHYSSAYDIALMSRELMKHEGIFEFTTIWMDSLRNGAFTLSNTNKLIRFYEGATGLKTGSTDKAKFCISATAKRGDMHLIAVIMAAPSSKERSADASKLLNYGFAGFGVLSCAKKGEVCDSIYIPKSGKDKIDIVCGEDAGYLYEKSNAPQLERTVNIRSDIAAPLPTGECVGNMVIKNGDEVVADIPLVTGEDIPKRGLGGTLAWLVGMWSRA